DLGVATCCGCCADMAREYLPGGRCSSVCNVQSVAMAVAPASAAAVVETGASAANSFPIPLVAAA
ncbi:MAG TPA: bacterioferritin, partial [Bordetella sp.]|nr:bacterioferritin [Bordetella sp.]